MKKPLISIVIPCYNEGDNIRPLFNRLSKVTAQDTQHEYEVLYVNDGSKDDTYENIKKLASGHMIVRVVGLSRNFGKEIATTAGIQYAQGDALIMLDADGQHPPELIPELIAKWNAGAKVVIGVRTRNVREGIVKRYGSKLFYALLNRLSGQHVIPGTTDFRLIDKVVQREFIRMTERSRMTRGLIDWLGFTQDYLYFEADARLTGAATYNFEKLVQLALNSFVSLSLKPLYFSLYAGVVVLPLSLAVGIFSVAEMSMGDPLHLRITGSGYLGLLIVFLVGLLLISQGITALYLSHIHIESQNRPLFVVDEGLSYGIRPKPVL